MALLPFRNNDDSPNAAAVFVNAVLCSALYHVDRRPFDLYATMSGGQVVAFQSDKQTFQPDLGVILANGEALVILDGTTNLPQWVMHCASAFFPAQDRHVPLTGPGHPFVVGSFYDGLTIIEPTLDQAISPIGTGAVKISGHSYGAAAALIYARHLSTSSPPPSTTEVMTFGEPRSYDARDSTREPDWHVRLIATTDDAINTLPNEQCDPVTTSPTGVFSLFSFARYVKFLKPILGISWSHHGTPWKISPSFLQKADASNIFLDVNPAYEVSLMAYNAAFYPLHFMDTSYLVKAMDAWQRSSLNPELSAFVPFVSEYTGTPFEPAITTGPPVSAATLNAAFFDPTNTPVTDSNRSQWESITAVGNISGNPEGGKTMTLMRGSFLCNIINQGFSETWHAASTGVTYASMQTKFANILAARAACSNCINDPPPTGNGNLVGFELLRVSDDLKQRDVFLTGLTTPVGWNGSSGNADGQLATKVVWRDEGNQQIAVTYLHGVPLGAQTGIETRKPVWTGTFKTAIQNYCNRVNSQNLGFNTLNLAPANAMGTITGIAYNAVSGNYTFTMSLPVPQGQFRVRIARMKSLRYLNGRWAAQATGANTFVLVRPAANIVWDNFGTALPLSGYNAGTPFSNYIVQVPASAQPTLIIARKLGRPFYLQHGRVSRRPAA